MTNELLEQGASAVCEVVKTIPLSTRLTLSNQIKTLSSIFNIQDNLLVDRRSMKPKLTEDELRTRRMERYRKKVEDPNYDRSYIVDSRNSVGPYQCGLIEAAKIAKMRPNSLRRFVSLHTKYTTSIDDEHGHMDILTIYRCNPDGSEKREAPKQVQRKREF